MILPTVTHLKTQQLALALGMSMSTIKRLVDAGEIRAARTSGRHRLIPVDEAIRFARSRNLRVDHLETAFPPQPTGSKPSIAISTWVADLADALGQGAEREARRIVLEASRGTPADELADELIAPAMRIVGDGWECGRIGVHQEHQATRILEQLLLSLIAVERERNGPAAATTPLALGAATEDDPYTLAGLLCELLLLQRRWSVTNFGANLPLPALAHAVEQRRPRLVWISINHLEDEGRFRREYQAVFEAAKRAGAAVALGGHALTPELRTRLEAACLCERMGHLAEFLRHINPLQKPEAGAKTSSR